MYFSTIITTALIAATASTMATPAIKRDPSGVAAFVCPDRPFSNPQCCGRIVFNAIGNDCSNLPEELDSPDDFVPLCQSQGKRPACCQPPIAGQDLLCQIPPLDS